MRVELKVLSPGMQDGRDSRHCAEIFSVGTQFQYRFGRRLKQQCVHGALPVSKNGIQLRRNGENNMKIRRVKQVFPLLVDPLFFCKSLAFGAVSVPAGVVRNPHISAVITGIYVRTQSSCPAIDDVLHSFSLNCNSSDDSGHKRRCAPRKYSESQRSLLHSRSAGLTRFAPTFAKCR